MLADFLGPYLVTIAGVVTTGIAAFTGRFLWRWTHAHEPTLVRLRLTEHSVDILNEGDFTVHFVSAEAPPPEPNAWKFALPKPRRIAPTKNTSLPFQEPQLTQLRIDRPYRVEIVDDHRARWTLAYAANDVSLNRQEGAGPDTIQRVWPRSLALLRRIATQWRGAGVWL
jgi:hypothetical protein